MLATALIIVVTLILVGALPRWSHSRSWGYGPSGGAGPGSGDSAYPAAHGSVLKAGRPGFPQP